MNMYWNSWLDSSVFELGFFSHKHTTPTFLEQQHNNTTTQQHNNTTTQQHTTHNRQQTTDQKTYDADPMCVASSPELVM